MFPEDTLAACHLERPTLMAGARAFSGEARMGQAHCRDPVLFVKIEPHLRLGRFLVPRW